LDEVSKSVEMAHRLDCSSLVVLSDGITSRTGERGAPESEKRSSLVEALKEAADLARDEGVLLSLEALNLNDHPGHFLPTSSKTLEVVREVNNSHLKMLYDIYHMQISEGNITSTLLGNIRDVGLIHFADVPGRHEPGTGELNLRFILMNLRDAHYRGAVGFEFSPIGSDEMAFEAIREQVKEFED